jgi:hypothetical protein
MHANVQCSKRWTRIADRGNGKEAGKCAAEEDAKLAEALREHGKHWVAVAAMVLGGRTNKRCRERWLNYLDPDRASNAAEEEEDNDGNEGALVSVLV